MTLFGELERTKVVFIDTCRNLVELGQLSKNEYYGICDVLDSLEEYDNELFEAELRRNSKGLRDLID